MLAASIDGFFAFLAACYELTLIMSFSCLIPLLFVANIFLSLLARISYSLSSNDSASPSSSTAV